MDISKLSEPDLDVLLAQTRAAMLQQISDLRPVNPKLAAVLELELLAVEAEYADVIPGGRH